MREMSSVLVDSLCLGEFEINELTYYQLDSRLTDRNVKVII